MSSLLTTRQQEIAAEHSSSFTSSSERASFQRGSSHRDTRAQAGARELLWGNQWSQDGALASGSQVDIARVRTTDSSVRRRVASYDSRRPVADQPSYSAASVHTRAPSSAARFQRTSGSHSYARNVGELSMRTVVGATIAIGIFFGGLSALVFNDSESEPLPTPTYVSSSLDSTQ